MNAKKLITAVLLVFVAGSLGYMIIRDRHARDTTAGVPEPMTLPEAKLQEPNEQLLVYYFHGDVRCPTCHKLEEYAKETLDAYFADELVKGKIKWMPVNVDTAGNEHFIKDYALTTKSVILSKIVDGKQVAWKNLDQIWQLVGEKDKYLKYIKDGIVNFAAEEQE